MPAKWLLKTGNGKIDMDSKRILQNLDDGAFFTHQEQAETAALIRTMQARIDFLFETNNKQWVKIQKALVHLQLGTELDVLEAIRILK